MKIRAAVLERMGMPMPYAESRPVAIESHVHLLSDHVKAAHAAGWALLEMDEGVVDDAWLATKYGVTGGGYVDFAVLRGDPSDGLPGVAGIGEKTAAGLVAIQSPRHHRRCQ